MRDYDVKPAPEKAAGPFELAGHAANEIERLEDRVSQLAARLAGWGGAPSPGLGKDTQRSGVFGALEAQAAVVIAAVERMNNALAAIERELP